jgi:hypothetical protein
MPSETLGHKLWDSGSKILKRNTLRIYALDLPGPEVVTKAGFYEHVEEQQHFHKSNYS